MTDAEMADKLARFVRNVPCRCERQWVKGASEIVTVCYRCRLLAEYDARVAMREAQA